MPIVWECSECHTRFRDADGAKCPACLAPIERYVTHPDRSSLLARELTWQERDIENLMRRNAGVCVE